MKYRDRITAALEELGPSTAIDIAEHIGIEKYAVHSALKQMRTTTPRFKRSVYICAWKTESADGEKRYPRPVWALGKKRDKPKPAPNRPAVQARYYHNRKTRALTSSVFNLAMKQNDWLRRGA